MFHVKHSGLIYKFVKQTGKIGVRLFFMKFLYCNEYNSIMEEKFWRERLGRF